MSAYPKRIMRDGTATTRRAHDVTPVTCAEAVHIACFQPLTSWAGDTIPQPDDKFHLWLDVSGAVHLTGPLAQRETVQFVSSLKRRALRAFRAARTDPATEE